MNAPASFSIGHEAATTTSFIRQIQIKDVPIIGDVARRVHNTIEKRPFEKRMFPGSRAYWEERYADGGNSGVGSYSKFSEFKAEIINLFINECNINSIIEFGCGDGNQLSLASYPKYTGFDTSETAISLCKERFTGDNTKSFYSMDAYANETADLTLSLDVIYHLIEDDVFECHMHQLFDVATRFVIIYSSDTDENVGYKDTIFHVRHRKFTKWVEANLVGWSLERHIPNRHPYSGDHTKGSFADFFIYKRKGR